MARFVTLVITNVLCVLLMIGSAGGLALKPFPPAGTEIRWHPRGHGYTYFGTGGTVLFVTLHRPLPLPTLSQSEVGPWIKARKYEEIEHTRISIFRGECATCGTVDKGASGIYEYEYLNAVEISAWYPLAIGAIFPVITYHPLAAKGDATKARLLHEVRLRSLRLGDAMP